MKIKYKHADVGAPVYASKVLSVELPDGTVYSADGQNGFVITYPDGHEIGELQHRLARTEGQRGAVQYHLEQLRVQYDAAVTELTELRATMHMLKLQRASEDLRRHIRGVFLSPVFEALEKALEQHNAPKPTPAPEPVTMDWYDLGNRIGTQVECINWAIDGLVDRVRADPSMSMVLLARTQIRQALVNINAHTDEIYDYANRQKAAAAIPPAGEAADL